MKKYCRFIPPCNNCVNKLYNCEECSICLSWRSELPTKQCRICRLTKCVVDFTAAPWSKDGREHQCVSCKAIKARAYWQQDKAAINERKRNEYKTKPWHIKYDKHLRDRYGITFKDFATLLFRQGGACAICETTRPTNHKWLVDHDHETGQVRGLLCKKCNTLVGYLEDPLVGEAKNYIAYHKSLRLSNK